MPSSALPDILSPLMVPLKLIFMAIWLGVTLASGATGWTGNSFVEEGGIAWEAHLGGYFFGLLAFAAFDVAAQKSSPSGLEHE